MRPQSTPSRQQFVRVCECGCGQPTLIAVKTWPPYGCVKGVPLRFLHNHHMKGARNSHWNGGRYQRKDGYVFIKRPNHPFANVRGYVEEHRLVVEARLGRYLTPAEIVHHDDENPANNTDDNLVLTTRPEHARHHATARGWSRQHDRCVNCGMTERKHEAHGRCWRCYQRTERAQARRT
jgi:hypothetical protein